MTQYIMLSALSMFGYIMLTIHPLPNQTANAIVGIGLLILYAITLGIAYNKEEKLKSRIQALEDKVENNADHIHKLAKKQSGKVIEYYTDEM